MVLLFVILVLATGCQVRVESTAEPTRVTKVDAAGKKASSSEPSAAETPNSSDVEVEFEDRLYRKLGQTIVWRFENEPLDKIRERLDKIRKRLESDLGVPVIFDQAALEAVGIKPDDEVNQHFKGVTREVALDLILNQFALDWTVAGNAVLISSRDQVEGMLVTRVYNVNDIVSGSGFEGANFDSLIDTIINTVCTDSWAENGGGLSEIRPLWIHSKGVLIIAQNRRAHRMIRKLLDDLRRVQVKQTSPAKPVVSITEFGKAAEREVKGLSLESDELKNAVQRSNQFSIDLFRRVVADSKNNDLVSGYSAREAMLLAAIGAKGETRAEFDRVLQLPTDSSKANLEAMSLRSYVQGSNTAASLFEVAYSVWVQPELNLKAEYAKTAEQFMGATARSIDFRHPADAVEVINGWSSEKTHKRIPKILSNEEITPQTNFMLVNAVYFLGKWQTAFDEKKTATGDFTLPDGKNIQVPMMNGEIGARYGFDSESELQIAELPYRGRTKSLVILLPPRGVGTLGQTKDKLSAENLDKWLAATIRDTITVRLPKFSFSIQHQLNEPLAALGGDRMFNLNSADFSGISDSPLAIEYVKQLAFIRVDESGTEAAAVTVGGAFGGAPPKSRELIVDRPFLLLIRDLTTGCVLFVGQVTDPRVDE